VKEKTLSAAAQQQIQGDGAAAKQPSSDSKRSDGEAKGGAGGGKRGEAAARADAKQSQLDADDDELEPADEYLEGEQEQEEEDELLHSTLVQTLFDEEESLLNLHMNIIQENAELLTEEGRLLQQIQGEDNDIDGKRRDEMNNTRRRK
jgi:hypothetical protein